MQRQYDPHGSHPRTARMPVVTFRVVEEDGVDMATIDMQVLQPPLSLAARRRRSGTAVALGRR